MPRVPSVWPIAACLLVAGCGAPMETTAGSEGNTYTVVGVPPESSMQACFREQVGNDEVDRDAFEDCAREAAGPAEIRDCDSPFDRASWMARQSTAGELPTDRQQAADQVTQCDLLDGLTRQEIRVQLGKPDDSLRADQPRYDTWVLGTERGFVPIDNEHLVVKYGDDGVVEKVMIGTD